MSSTSLVAWQQMQSLKFVQCSGINQWDVETPPRYHSNTHLAARVGNLNPRWNEDSSAERTDAQFQKAVQLTGSEFLESVDYLAKVGSPAQLQDAGSADFQQAAQELQQAFS